MERENAEQHAEDNRCRDQDRIPGDLAGGAKARHACVVHRGNAKAEDRAANLGHERGSCECRNRKARCQRANRDEQGGHGLAGHISGWKARFKSKHCEKMRGPRGRPGGEPGKKQPLIA